MMEAISNKTQVVLNNIQNFGIKVFEVIGDASVGLLDIGTNVLPAFANAFTFIDQINKKNLLALAT